MIQKINQVTQESENAILHTKASRVNSLADIAELIQDLLDTAQSSPTCIGLAANQIWKNTQQPPPNVFVALIKNSWQVFINATIAKSGGVYKPKEGCMSVPKKDIPILRRGKVFIHYLDNQFKPHKRWYDKVDAIILQHETDHLNGKTINE